MKRDETGMAMIVWALGLAFVLMIVILLVTDAWRLIAADRALSAAVDGAASAGANGIDEAAFRDSGVVQLDPDRAESLASDNLSAQPDANLLVGVSISATPEHVSVAAERPVHLLLTGIIGELGRTVHAAAEATPRRSP